VGQARRPSTEGQERIENKSRRFTAGGGKDKTEWLKRRIAQSGVSAAMLPIGADRTTGDQNGAQSVGGYASGNLAEAIMLNIARD